MSTATPPLSAADLVLRARRLEIDAVRHLAARAELVDLVGQLVDALQRERGATGVYLASHGERPQGRANPARPPGGFEQSGRATFAHERPQGRANPARPPRGFEQSGRATFAQERPQGRANPARPPGGFEQSGRATFAQERFAEVRQATIDEAVPLGERLRALVAAEREPPPGADARMPWLMAWALLGLDALAGLRAQIDSRTISAHEAIAAYSRVIAGLVELIFHVADATPVPGISRLLVALLHLVQGKEAAGQERALGGLLFASGTCSEAQQQRVVHLIDAQERSLRVFAEFADPALRERWERHQLAPAMAQLERLRRLLCTARPAAPLDTELSSTWFDVASERIAELRALQEQLVARLRAGCDEQIREAQQDLLDSQGLLRRLRENPPPRTHAVDRFFDAATAPAAITLAANAETTSLLELLQSQSARLASVEAELGAARRALHERKLIERAKGVLMARLALTEEAAFRALQKTSMDQKRRLAEVAEATLALPDFVFERLAPAGPPPGAGGTR